MMAHRFVPSMFSGPPSSNDVYAYTFSVDQFSDMIASDRDVDLDRLKAAARFGIPSSVRGEVWKLLLEVTHADKSEELSRARMIREEFARLRGEAERQVDTLMLRSIRG